MRVIIRAKNGTAEVFSQIKTDKRLKLKVSCGAKSIYHDITDSIIVPLTFGSGDYSFILYQQVVKNRYLQISRKKINILLESDAYTFSPNSYVNYNRNSTFYQTAQNLGSLEKIKDYICKNFYYDYIGALITAKKTFTTPDINKCYEEKKGTCYELSALFVAMLRICGVSSKLVIGTADSHPHAWAVVNEKRYDITKELNHTKVKIYKSERFY